MPNRIIKESIRESYEIDKLTPEAEVMFYRLLTYADDYGRFKADPRLLNKALFPLKKYRDKQVQEWADNLSLAGLISFYSGVDGKPYGQFLKWALHQNIRSKKSKHPPPHDKFPDYFTSIPETLNACNIICSQMNTNVPVIQSIPIQHESESNHLYTSESEEIRLAKLLFSLIQQRDEKAKEPNFQKWAVHINHLYRLDERTFEEIEELIVWCQKNEFWHKNILSTRKLREKFAQLWLTMKQDIKKKKGGVDEFKGKKYAGTPRENIGWLQGDGKSVS
jgi:hypothetical protein